MTFRPPTTVPPSLLSGDTGVLMIVGSYGSGKTEVAVNTALGLAREGRRVQIADLDLVNPYFRCREARQLMEANDIRVVMPCGAQAYADLPIVLPEIRGMLHPPPGTVSIFDVGGDDVGARSLSAFRPFIAEGGYRMVQVVNARRPFTSTVDGALRALREIEAASRLRVTGLLANTHLLDATTPEVVLDGLEQARRVAAMANIPLHAVAAMEHLTNTDELSSLDVPLLHLQRHMVPPWMAGRNPNSDSLPAGRPVPIGVPPSMAPGPSPGGGHLGQD